MFYLNTNAIIKVTDQTITVHISMYVGSCVFFMFQGKVIISSTLQICCHNKYLWWHLHQTQLMPPSGVIKRITSYVNNCNIGKVKLCQCNQKYSQVCVNCRVVTGVLGLPHSFELISKDLFGCLNLANLCGLQLTGLPWIPPYEAWICSRSLPTFLRHQFPSSFIGDDLNITWRQVSLNRRIFNIVGKNIIGISLIPATLTKILPYRLLLANKN